MWKVARTYMIACLVRNEAAKRTRQECPLKPGGALAPAIGGERTNQNDVASPRERKASNRGADKRNGGGRTRVSRRRDGGRDKAKCE